MKTRVIKQKEVLPVNFLIDAKGQILGKVAVKASKLLLGKSRVNSTKYITTIDNVYIKNASLVEVDPMRSNKTYQRHSMYPGGFKEINILKLRDTNPDKLFRISIKGMLPKNRLGRIMMGSLKIIKDDRVPELTYKLVN